MEKQICDLTKEEYDLDTPVRYDEANMNGKPLAHNVQKFYKLLSTITELYGQIPKGMVQRYGPKPLETYMHGSQNLQMAMERAMCCAISYQNPNHNILRRYERVTNLLNHINERLRNTLDVV